MAVVSWALTDVPPGAGGFGCIPGSHKANLACPAPIRDGAERSDCVVQVPLEAGDAVIFTEALTHGTLGWHTPFSRRVLFYRYTPGYMRFEVHDQPDHVLALMTPRQRRLLEPPFARISHGHRRPEVE
jgi:ectoine hydroxylase-related dioxygenase (phytanoyl-CoA dioxygenase family)